MSKETDSTSKPIKCCMYFAGAWRNVSIERQEAWGELPLVTVLKHKRTLFEELQVTLSKTGHTIWVNPAAIDAWYEGWSTDRGTSNA